MRAHYDRNSILLLDPIQCRCEAPKTAFDIHVFRSVEGDEEVACRLQVQLVQNRGTVNLRLVILEDFENRVAGHIDALARNSFPQEILATLLRVWKKNIRGMVDDATIDF